MEQVVLPNFWLKLGKHSTHKLSDCFYFIIFLTSIKTTQEGRLLNARHYIYYRYKCGYIPLPLKKIYAKKNHKDNR